MSNKLSVLFFLFFLSHIAFSQQVIPLYEGMPPNARVTAEVKNFTLENTPIGKIDQVVVTPTLTIYLPEKNKRNGAAVVICPGGGYAIVARTHEGEAFAERLAAAGVTAFVLQYRLPHPKYVTNKEVVPLQDAQHAIAIVRERAAEWGIDPKRVGIMGSSAGGHLASTIGTHFQYKYDTHMHTAGFRPDFMILLYPVISFADSITHNGSRFNLIGPEREDILDDPSQIEKKMVDVALDSAKKINYSNERQVTERTPPVFIVHANDDEVVPIQNTILFVAALQEKKVRVQPLFYAGGGHGFGLHNKSSSKDWMAECITWLRKEGITNE